MPLRASIALPSHHLLMPPILPNQAMANGLAFLFFFLMSFAVVIAHG